MEGEDTSSDSSEATSGGESQTMNTADQPSSNANYSSKAGTTSSTGVIVKGENSGLEAEVEIYPGIKVDTNTFTGSLGLSGDYDVTGEGHGKEEGRKNKEKEPDQI